MIRICHGILIILDWPVNTIVTLFLIRTSITINFLTYQYKHRPSWKPTSERCCSLKPFESTFCGSASWKTHPSTLQTLCAWPEDRTLVRRARPSERQTLGKSMDRESSSSCSGRGWSVIGCWIRSSRHQRNHGDREEQWDDLRKKRRTERNEIFKVDGLSDLMRAEG